MASEVDKQMLAQREYDYPQLIQRYIAKYRELKGVGARRNTAASNKWFSDRISKDGNLKAERVHRELVEKITRNPNDRGLIGRLFLFKYDAKTKDSLPVWDEWPLTFFFNAFIGDGRYGEKGVTYLMGLNMHYLPPKYRVKLFIELVKLKNDSTLRKKTRLKMTWNILKAMSTSNLAQHSVKMYRVDHIKSRLAEVHPDQWEVVIPMRIARWKNGSKSLAWKGL